MEKLAKGDVAVLVLVAIASVAVYINRCSTFCLKLVVCGGLRF